MRYPTAVSRTRQPSVHYETKGKAKKKAREKGSGMKGHTSANRVPKPNLGEQVLQHDGEDDSPNRRSAGGHSHHERSIAFEIRAEDGEAGRKHRAERDLCYRRREKVSDCSTVKGGERGMAAHTHT